MRCRERTLRVLVEKWLGRETTGTMRVMRSSHGARKLWRYVRVEAHRFDGAFSIIFFRHDDGSWYVYPPTIQHPAMATAHPSYEPRAVARGT